MATGYDAWIEASGKKKEGGRFYGVTFDYIRRYFGEPNNGVGDFQGGLHEHLYLNNGELGRRRQDGNRPGRPLSHRARLVGRALQQLTR